MLPTNLPNKHINLHLQLLILPNILPTRHRDLNKHNLLLQLRVTRQKIIKPEQLLLQVLDVVQPVHADDHFRVRVAVLELLDALARARVVLQRVAEFARLDAHDEFADAGFSVRFLRVAVAVAVLDFGVLGVCCCSSITRQHKTYPTLITTTQKEMDTYNP